MDREYAESRIRDALNASDGNAAKARQILLSWAIEDNRLLHELVAPHISGIVAHAVNRVMTMKKKPAPAPTPVAAPEKSDKASKDPFGMEILKAIALGNPAQFGQENGVPLKKQQASQRHIDAIREMVSKKDTKRT